MGKQKFFRNLRKREEYENFIIMLFYIANLKANNKYTKIFGFNYEYLTSVTLNNKENSIVKKFYNNIDELKNFIKSILYSAKEPFYFEMEYVAHIYDNDYLEEEYENCLTKQDITTYLTYCFEKNANNLSEFNDNFWQLFHAGKLKEWIDIGGGNVKRDDVFIPEVIDIFKNKVLTKFTDDFFVNIIKPQDFYNRSCLNLFRQKSSKKISNFGLQFKKLIIWNSSVKIK